MPILQLKQSSFKSNGSGCESIELSVDIIAVHGLDENMTEAWTDPATNILWLRDLLPEALSVARVLTYGYNANITSFCGSRSSDRIQQHAQTLVADIQADRSLEGCPKRPIIFICHGLGGIVVKKALAYSSTRTSKHLAHLYSIFASTYAILFFGTPHHGIDKGSWLATARGKYPLAQARPQKNSQLLMAIEKDSETLQAITDQFTPLLKQFHIFFFWEENETRLEDGTSYIVEESSAAPIIDNTERAGICANHSQMVRFSGRHTSSYRTVVEALVRYCRNAPSIISRRWQQAAKRLAEAWSNEAMEISDIVFDVHNDNRPSPYQRKLSERPRNKHFHIPQVVSSIFTGREDISHAVEESLFTPQDDNSPRQQRRFIIHGIGGSGKTQFCSKFAQDYRERFWGVFWIDATTMETARQSFAKIGKLGEMEATQSAGKHWLSNSEEPWLLIINNVDDPGFDLPSLFPEGERGYVLVTTRNPNFRVHGTVGACEFKGLKQKDALLLLLRAADTPKPWNTAVESMGNKITDALGCLALALIQAGALILQRMCDMRDYLDFYNQFRSKIGARRSSGSSRNDDQFTVYATWEHSLDWLENRKTEASLDAAQLLSIVAFFHFEHIRVDIFVRALSNKIKATQIAAKSSILSRLSNGICARAQPPRLLPEFLRQEPSDLDQYRIRRALHELCSLSLISYDGKDDSFSLHPVVHSWARDRLKSGEQALWAHVALNVLAESILLPPDDSGEAHEEFRRDILVHLDLCLNASPIKISNYEARFGGSRFPIMLVLQPTWVCVFRHQVLSAAKCGYVYAERGRFNEAAELLFGVKEALVKSRGYRNEMTMRAMLALAGTYWGLGRLEEAVALQKIVVEARTDFLGPEHAETLSAMDQLGRSFWLNGQYKEALDLQLITMDRMKATLGNTHTDTLSAIDNLGVTYGSWQRFRESRDLHHRVLAERRKSLGSSHLDTLVAMNNLAMALKDLGILNEARELMNEVYERRKTKLGKEHPWTLWALCNLAKVHTELKLLQVAEDMLVGGIAAAKRSLSENHLGVLMGVGELARVFARQGRLEEASGLLEDLIPRLEHSRGPGHPDTVYALFKLTQLYKMQNKHKKAMETCALANERAKIKLTMEHPMARDITWQLERLKQDEKHINKDLIMTTVTEITPYDHQKLTNVFFSRTKIVPTILQSHKTF